MNPAPYVLYGLVATTLLLAALARWGRIYPNRLAVLVAIAPAVVSVGLAARPELLWPLAMADAALAAIVLADLATVPRRRSFSIQRQSERIVSLGKPHSVTLTVAHHGRRRRRIWLRDDQPAEFHVDRAEFTASLAGASRATLSYQLTARRRGAFTLATVYLKANSLGGFWQRHVHCPVSTLLHVYPDMRQLEQYALLARTNRLSLVGVRRTRRVGQDHEFERLRDFTLDDNYKHIDWRSTARRNRLTVKDFQASQSQRLLFLVDCGRMMTGTAADGLTLLDHALNAVLMLSYVALRQGDSVGLVSFSDGIHSYVPPHGGPAQMNRLLHASFDRFPRLVESRYDLAFLHLAGHCRKRSLVVLITNVIDEVNAAAIEQYLASLAGKHLPLGVLLRDRQLFDAVAGEPAGDEALFRAAAAADILAWRRQVLQDLHSKGVLMLDVFPEQLTAPLVNRYLEVKARHLL